MTIKVICHTNLDRYCTAEWPSEMAFPPRVGDYVRAENGHQRLRVVAVTHTKVQGSLSVHPVGSAVVLVELHE
jgi:vacuolar-type H+-ATPase catalytic subunit A/Vma1